jgi:TFIIF-interacting CTD phosphatase-like protein
MKISYNGKSTRVYSVKRFGLDSFLFEMSQLYELIVFTASQKQYADKVIQEIDAKKRISHVLNRDHCIVINKIYYLKNLKILGRDLKQVILVDVIALLIKG